MKHRHQVRKKPTRLLTPTQRRNERIRHAVSGIEIQGAHDRPNRQDWAESRKRAGWSERIVNDAIGAASLAKVRAVADGRDDPPECRCRFDNANEKPRKVYTCRWCRALGALPVIDAGRPVEVTLPRRVETEAKA